MFIYDSNDCYIPDFLCLLCLQFWPRMTTQAFKQNFIMIMLQLISEYTEIKHRLIPLGKGQLQNLEDSLVVYEPIYLWLFQMGIFWINEQFPLVFLALPSLCLKHAPASNSEGLLVSSLNSLSFPCHQRNKSWTENDL